MLTGCVLRRRCDRSPCGAPLGRRLRRRWRWRSSVPPRSYWPSALRNWRRKCAVCKGNECIHAATASGGGGNKRCIAVVDVHVTSLQTRRTDASSRAHAGTSPTQHRAARRSNTGERTRAAMHVRMGNKRHTHAAHSDMETSWVDRNTAHHGGASLPRGYRMPTRSRTHKHAAQGQVVAAVALG